MSDEEMYGIIGGVGGLIVILLIYFLWRRSKRDKMPVQQEEDSQLHSFLGN